GVNTFANLAPHGGGNARHQLEQRRQFALLAKQGGTCVAQLKLVGGRCELLFKALSEGRQTLENLRAGVRHQAVYPIYFAATSSASSLNAPGLSTAMSASTL